MDFFDYHFYRVAKYYYKRDGSDATTALISVSSVQSWIMINILIFIKDFFFREIKFEFDWVIILLIMGGTYLYNKKRYLKKYIVLREKWSKESDKKKWINGIVIIVTIVFSWSLIFLNGLIFNRYW